MKDNKQFEDWLEDKDGFHYLCLGLFDELPFTMQWGVYLEFFDSVGIYISEGVFSYSPAKWSIEIVWHELSVGKSLFSHKENNELVWLPFDLNLGCYVWEIRQEAQQEAITKAFEILEK